MSKLSVLCREAADRLEEFLSELKEQTSLKAPERDREMNRVFSLQQVAELIGVTPSYINQLSKEEGWPKALYKNNRRIGWDLDGYLAIREKLKRCPFTEEQRALRMSVIVAVANFKGGSAKTTTSVSAAQGLCLQGFKVLVVDIDPQASNTMQWKSEEINSSDGYMLSDYILSEKQDGEYVYYQDKDKMPSVKSVIKHTHWKNIDLIQANSELHLVEVGLANKADDYNLLFWTRLKDIIGEIKQPYDVVLVDFPPSLNFSSINGLFAANAVIVPTPPEHLDLTSTLEFLNISAITFEYYEKQSEVLADFRMLKLLLTKTEIDGTKEGGLKLKLGDLIFQNGLLDSKVYKNTADEYTTPFEVNKYHDRKSYKRCIDNLSSWIDELVLSLKENFWEVNEDEKV